MTKRNPEFGGFSACFAVRAETDQKGKATPPARTETWCGALTPLAGINFNPLRPRGRRRLNQDRTASIRNFNPLRPRGRRPLAVGLMANSGIFQPTPPARTETPGRAERNKYMNISTHSAREDGDYQYSTMEQSPDNFNPLRPRGRRLLVSTAPLKLTVFQPTPPARTETNMYGFLPGYPSISTHSAREDGDERCRPGCIFGSLFQPTPPARTETGYEL